MTPLEGGGAAGRWGGDSESTAAGTEPGGASAAMGYGGGGHGANRARLRSSFSATSDALAGGVLARHGGGLLVTQARWNDRSSGCSRCVAEGAPPVTT